MEVRAEAREGFVVAAEGANIAALVTTLTPELAREGLAREFVRRVQDLRKSSGLEISDRIDLLFDASPELAKSIAENSDYITNETLALSLDAGKGDEGWVSAEDNFDGERLLVWLRKHM